MGLRDKGRGDFFVNIFDVYEGSQTSSTYPLTLSLYPRSLIVPKIFAGLPATIVFGGTSFVMTLPAPKRAFSPIVTLARIVQLEPIEDPVLTRMGSTVQSASVCSLPSGVVARG